MPHVFRRVGWAYKFLYILSFFATATGCANALGAQEQDLIWQGSRWSGEILQGNQTFSAIIYISDRSGERLRGEIDFTSSFGQNRLRFQGDIVDNNLVVWITEKVSGSVTYPGLYIGRINGKQISGTWQVPSAGQYDQFTVTLME